MSSPPWTPPKDIRSYDVFLSFRGKDTRYTFTAHLLDALKRAGVNTFADDHELKRGADLTINLVQAVQGSRMSLIVFSENYASSSWCLDELGLIMECKQSKGGQMVFPIFYHVDPSVVRYLKDSFSDAFDKHKARYDTDKVDRWRSDLVAAADLYGWHLRNDGNEAKFIKEIVDEITTHLSSTYLNVALYPVGIDSRIGSICESLAVGLDDIRIVGIWGMGGIGKTSLAKAIYNRFYYSFESKSFLGNVRTAANVSNGKIKLQERLLSDILKQTNIQLDTEARGVNVIKERLERKRVLVIVDDVDDVDQLNALAIRHDSFGPGSRVIITTRDRHLLDLVKVDAVHLTREMNKEEALELFSWHAFQNCSPTKTFFELSKAVVAYCGGLPLALEVLGSFLFKRSIRDWDSTLEKLKIIPDDRIQEKLIISFDALDENQREIYLHITCFFIGMNKNYATHVLDGCGYFSDIGISVLVQRCLVTVNEKNKLMMHDLLRDMGREVVRVEDRKLPEKRSRLWRLEDVTDVLTRESGTEQIEGLSLNPQKSDKLSFTTEAFANMTRLKFLQLSYVHITGDYNNISKYLRWLSWRGFPLKFIRKEFLNEKYLVYLDLRYSNLVQVWEHSRLLQKLKILNLSHSHCLTQSPDFSKVPNLEYLIMKDCVCLSEIHKSIGHLKRLSVVDLKDSVMLQELPESFYKLKVVKTLVLSGCSRFDNLAEDIGELRSLATLDVSGTAITKVPSSVGRLKNLIYSSLQGLIRLHLRFPRVPTFHFPALTQGFTSLKYLILGTSSFHRLQKLRGVSNLERLCVDTCSNELEANHCTSLVGMIEVSEISRKESGTSHDSSHEDQPFS